MNEIVNELQTIKNEMEQENRVAERLNNASRDSRSKAELLASQFETACKKYEAKYGVSINKENIQVELESVLAKSKQELEYLKTLTNLISTGRIDEANVIAGVVPVPVSQTVVISEPVVNERPVDAVISSEDIPGAYKKVSVPVEPISAPASQPIVAEEPVVNTRPTDMDIPNKVMSGTPLVVDMATLNQSLKQTDGVDYVAPVEDVPQQVAQPQKVVSMNDLINDFNASLGTVPKAPSLGTTGSASGKINLSGLNLDD